MSGTAHVHPGAQLTPGKLDLLGAWLPDQEWFDGDPSHLERVAAFRFVDPDGEVGLDCMIIESAGSLFHVPVTWRGTPLPGGSLIGTLEHSVLGTRHCYDAPTDPVYMTELARIIREADSDADIVAEGSNEARARTIIVEGTGSCSGGALRGSPYLIRALDGTWPTADAHLIGTWHPHGTGRRDVLATLD